MLYDPCRQPTDRPFINQNTILLLLPPDRIGKHCSNWNPELNKVAANYYLLEFRRRPPQRRRIRRQWKCLRTASPPSKGKVSRVDAFWICWFWLWIRLCAPDSPIIPISIITWMSLEWNGTVQIVECALESCVSMPMNTRSRAVQVGLSDWLNLLGFSGVHTLLAPYSERRAPSFSSSSSCLLPKIIAIIEQEDTVSQSVSRRENHSNNAIGWQHLAE